MNNEIIRILRNSLVDIHKAKLYFMDYLNSGSKVLWDEHVIKNSFVMGLANLCDKKIFSHKKKKEIEEILDHLNPADYTPENRGNQIKHLEQYIDAEKKIALFILNTLNSKQIKTLETSDHEFYSVWHNLKVFL